MSSLLFGLISSLFVSFLGIQDPVLTLDEPVPGLKKSCQPVEWVREPALNGSKVTGEAQVLCHFKALGGGGYTQLEGYLKGTLNEHAYKVWEGPISRDYESLPGEFWDVTFRIGKKNSEENVVYARTDLNLATDFERRLIVAAKTTDVAGQGYGEYLDGVALRAQIDPADSSALPPEAEAGEVWYSLHAQTSFELTKPWFVPGGFFLNKIRSTVEEKQEEGKERLIREVAPNI